MRRYLKHRLAIFKTIFIVIIDPIIVAATFILPIVFSSEYSSYLRTCKGIICWSIAILFFIGSGISSYFKYRSEINRRKNQRSRDILSNLNEVFDIKAEQVRSATYRPYEKHPHNSPLHYDVHAYIRSVCQRLRRTLSTITEIDYSCIDVGLIYKYHNEDNWKWLSGKSGTSGAKELKVFMDEPTLFHYISHTSDIVFANDKQDCKFYLLKRRDHFFNDIGSVMGMPLTYFNDADALIDFILVITTYGARFVESTNEHTINDFKETLVFEVLPYYISLMQTPFGEMYLRHYIRNYDEAGNKRPSP